MKIITVVIIISIILAQQANSITTSGTYPTNSIYKVDKIVIKNIIIKEIKGNIIYSTDGQTFKIKSYTKIIDNSRAHGKSNIKIAELHIKNENLILVIYK